MSRSKRKTPVFGIIAARSEKQDKRLANRKLRRKTRIDPENAPMLREVSDVWGFAKDGKKFMPPTSPAFRLTFMRK